MLIVPANLKIFIVFIAGYAVELAGDFIEGRCYINYIKEMLVLFSILGR